MRAATVIYPTLVVEAARVHHKLVAFPAASGIAQPGGVGHWRMGTSIRKNLTVMRVLFIQDNRQTGILYDLYGITNEPLVGYAVWQTMR